MQAQIQDNYDKVIDLSERAEPNLLKFLDEVIGPMEKLTYSLSHHPNPFDIPFFTEA